VPVGWLKLALTPGLGPAALERIGLEPEHWGELHELPLAELRRLGFGDLQAQQLRLPDPEWFDRALAWLDHPSHHLVTRIDPLYPPLLARIDDAPPVLFVNGDPGCLPAPQLAVIGSRKATRGGLEIAAEFAGRLARAGLTVTSGLAAGIDGAAHQAAIDAGGQTIAVAGTGPDQVYPARHRDLARRIVDNGAVVTSFPPGVGPRPGNFPARNRIISGMSVGVLVIEAGMRSGSLITARLAGDQGREVFAVPGSIRNPLARGCHRLIRQGARLVETAEELLEDIAPLVGELAGELRARLDQDSEAGETGVEAGDGETPAGRLLEVIGHDPVSVDRLIEHTGMSTSEISALLMELELEGRVSPLGGGRYVRA
jgi:DNA processing protein